MAGKVDPRAESRMQNQGRRRIRLLHVGAVSGIPLAIWLAIALYGAVIATPSAQERVQRIGLFIGNGKYPDAVASLGAPAKDARLLADQFRQLDFETTLKEDASKVDLRAAIETFVGSVRKGSVALLYFSGIALQGANNTFLIPVDANIWSEADSQREAISVESILAQIQEKGATTKIVIVDAAYRNPFERRFRNVPAGLATLIAPTGTLAVYSTAPGRRAPETSNDPSVFTGELLKTLRNPDRPAETIFNETRTGVSRASNNTQVPWVASSLVEEFRFARVAPPAPSTPAPAEKQQAPAPAPAAKAAPPPPSAAPAPPASVATPKQADPAPSAAASPKPDAAPPATPAPAEKAEQPPNAETARQVFARHYMLGTFAENCRRPPSEKHPYTTLRPLDRRRVQQTVVTVPWKRPSVLTITGANDTGPQEFAVSGTRGREPVTGNWQIEKGRVRWTADGETGPWLQKCSN
jgi:hypothetical protein